MPKNFSVRLKLYFTIVFNAKTNNPHNLDNAFYKMSYNIVFLSSGLSPHFDMMRKMAEC